MSATKVTSVQTLFALINQKEITMAMVKEICLDIQSKCEYVDNEVVEADGTLSFCFVPKKDEGKQDYLTEHPNGRFEYKRTVTATNLKKYLIQIDAHILMTVFHVYKNVRAVLQEEGELSKEEDCPFIDGSLWQWDSSKECAHSCNYGNKGCLAPNHIDVGTKSENIRCANLSCFGLLICKNDVHGRDGLMLCYMCPHNFCRNIRKIHACHVCSPGSLPATQAIGIPESPVSPYKDISKRPKLNIHGNRKSSS